MATSVQVPVNVSTITLSISGVLNAGLNGNSENVISGMTDAEATTLVANDDGGTYLVTTNPVTGATTIRLPLIVTSITINGNVYAPDVNGYIYNVPAADATVFLQAFYNRTFIISTGA